MKRTSLSYLVVPLMVLICWQQASALSAKEQLVKIKQEMKKKQETLAQTLSRENSTSKKIQVRQRQAREQGKRIAETEKRISTLQTGIGMKQKDLATEKSARQDRQQMWQSRLSGYYRATMAGTAPLLDTTPGSDSHHNDAVPVLIHAVSGDKATIAVHDRKIGLIGQETHQLVGQKQQQLAERESGKRALSQLERDKAENALRLAATRKEREKLVEEIRAFEAKQKRLASLLASLQKKSRKKIQTEKRLSSSKGPKDPKDPKEPKESKNPKEPGEYRKQAPPSPNFPRYNMPVTGKIIRSYGVHENPDWHTKTFSNGVTIAAPAGSPVRAIADGTVAYVGNLKGYGNVMIIDHGSQVFGVYGQCGTMMVKEGAKVKRAESIASVGSGEGEESALYFEVRRQGKSVNPAGGVTLQ